MEDGSTYIVPPRPSPNTSAAPSVASTSPESSENLGISTTVQEQRMPMLEVHPSQSAIHSWRDFFIHIATICVGLLIAVVLEQTVEAVHHHHQREKLLVSLDHDTRATLQDADFAADERLRRMQWNQVRIEQVQAALASHKPLAPAAPQKNAFITVPA